MSDPAEFVLRADRRIAELRTSLEQARTERRILLRWDEPEHSAPLQRIARSVESLADRERVLEGELGDLEQIAARWHEHCEFQHREPEGASSPEWLHQARVLLKIADLDRDQN